MGPLPTYEYFDDDNWQSARVPSFEEKTTVVPHRQPLTCSPTNVEKCEIDVKPDTVQLQQLCQLPQQHTSPPAISQRQYSRILQQSVFGSLPEETALKISPPPKPMMSNFTDCDLKYSPPFEMDMKSSPAAVVDDDDVDDLANLDVSLLLEWFDESRTITV